METTPTTISAAELQVTRTRAALDFLAQRPDAPTPMITAYASGNVEVDWFVDDVDQMREIRRALGGTWDKDPLGPWFILRMTRDGVRYGITASRDNVCEPVVVGQETVTVPAVEAQPERVEVRDVIEWRCEPLNDTEAVSA